jgi:hypothetical protein
MSWNNEGKLLTKTGLPCFKYWASFPEAIAILVWLSSGFA